MRDRAHIEFIEKWADFVKKNPGQKKQHTEFINSQFKHSEDFFKRLAKEKNGKEKIIKLFNIKNIKGYEDILG